MKRFWDIFFPDRKLNWVQRRYAYGVKHYGEILPGKQCRLKRKIRERLGIKPRVRYKLTTVRTQYQGYLFIEWK